MEDKIKSYKDLEHLKQECLKNNGKKVFVWDDRGIIVGKKKFYFFEYGNMGYNFTGKCFVTFRNEGHKGKTNRNNPITEKDRFITIEYLLLKNRDNDKIKDIFKFVLIRENH